MAAVALFAIMCVTLVDVGGRTLVSRSLPGGLELTEVLMVCVIFAALPLVSWRGEHVVFDTFAQSVPPKWRRLQLRWVHVLSGCAFGWLAWLMVLKAQRFASYSDTTAFLQLPLAPVAWGMALALFLTGLVHMILAVVGDQVGQDGDAQAAASPVAQDGRDA